MHLQFATVKNPVSKRNQELIQPRGRNFSYYTGVQANFNNGLVRLGFKIDYTVDHALSKTKITSLYDKKVIIVPGTFSDLSSGYWPDFRNPTNGWMTCNVTLGNTVSTYAYLKMFVDGNGNTWTESQA